MSKGKFDIKSILDISRWEAVQDQLAKETGTAIITIDYKGTPLTKHSMRTEFCSIIREKSHHPQALPAVRLARRTGGCAAQSAVHLSVPLRHRGRCRARNRGRSVSGRGDVRSGARLERVGRGGGAPCQRDKLLPRGRRGERPAARSARAETSGCRRWSTSAYAALRT